MRELNELRVKAMLAEHQALRSEVVALVGRQSSISYWAASSGAVLVAAVLASWSKIANVPNALPLVFCLAFPLAATAYLIAWFWIAIALANLGAYIYLLERKVSAALPARATRTENEAVSSPTERLARRLAREPMGWEHYLQFDLGNPAQPKHAFIPAARKTAKWATVLVYAIANAFGTWLFREQFEATSQPPSTLHMAAVLVGPWIGWSLVWLLFFRIANREFNETEEKVKAFDALGEEDLMMS